MTALVRCLLVSAFTLGAIAPVQAGDTASPLPPESRESEVHVWVAPSPLSRAWLTSPTVLYSPRTTLLLPDRQARYLDLLLRAEAADPSPGLLYMDDSPISASNPMRVDRTSSAFMQVGHTAFVGGIMAGGRTGKYIAAGGAGLYTLGLIGSLWTRTGIFGAPAPKKPVPRVGIQIDSD